MYHLQNPFTIKIEMLGLGLLVHIKVVPNTIYWSEEMVRSSLQLLINSAICEKWIL